VNSIVSYVKLK